jgi:hypothetical protein
MSGLNFLHSESNINGMSDGPNITGSFVSFTNQYQTIRYLEYGHATAFSWNSLLLCNSSIVNDHIGIIVIHS